MLGETSTPSLFAFDARHIPYQMEVIDDVEKGFDYSLGTHEVLLSGSVGSAKSILLAHLAVKHCLKFCGARVVICRRARPDIRLTIWRKILEHLEGSLDQGRDYAPNRSDLAIAFRNGSEIISRSWADGHYHKLRSLELSMAIVEELTENNEKDKQAYDELKMRVGRLPHIKQKLIISATNPDEPDHWAYKHFIEPNQSGLKHATRHVYYSVTTDNPFLPPEYISQLKTDMDPLLAQRMIYGRWLSIRGQCLYWAYEKEFNFRDYSYDVKPKLPIHLAFDFNIGEGKPMSAALLQHDGLESHVFNQSVIMGARTADIIDDLDARGLLQKNQKYIVSGDASGRHRDTRSKKSDYGIITDALTSLGIDFEMRVPPANPPIRTRHNKVNARLLNAHKVRSLFVYKDAPKADEGFRLTKLKEGGHYIEDDSKDFQHITTAIGYDIVMEDKYRKFTGSKTILL